MSTIFEFSNQRWGSLMHGMRWVCDVIMCGLQTSIEKSFSYSYTVPETSTRESQRAGDGRDGCFTRVDEKWNSSETTPTSHQNEAWTTLPAEFMTQPLPPDHAACMNVSCVFTFSQQGAISSYANFDSSKDEFASNFKNRGVYFISAVMVKLCDFFEYNWKKQQRTRNPSWPKRNYYNRSQQNVQLVPRRRTFFCPDLKLKDHSKKWLPY